MGCQEEALVSHRGPPVLPVLRRRPSPVPHQPRAKAPQLVEPSRCDPNTFVPNPLEKVPWLLWRLPNRSDGQGFEYSRHLHLFIRLLRGK